MIELYQFGQGWGINPSPFCLKAETYLRLAGLPYEVRRTLPNKAPRGKLPYIVDQGQVIPDSGEIIAYVQATYGDRLDADLSAQDRALAHLIRRTIEDSLFYVMVYSRWVDPIGLREMRKAFLDRLPFPLRLIVPPLMLRRIKRMLHGQGYGRLSSDKIYAQGNADLQALLTILGDKPFLLGDHPTSVDASLYGFLVNILRVPIETDLKRAAQALPGLTAYLDRMDAALAAR